MTSADLSEAPANFTYGNKPELMVFPGTVMVSGELLPILHWALALIQRQRSRDGYAPSPALTDLRAAISGAMSAGGHTDVRDQADEEPERWVTTAEVAQRLGCSTRHARRLAAQLGGIRKQGRWHIDALALLEHQEGSIS